MALNQLTGGPFTDILGNPLAEGTLTLELSQDCITVDGATAIAGGRTLTIQLDGSGDVQTSPPQYVYGNDALVPANYDGGGDSDTYYLVRAYSAAGQRVWGPNAQQVLSTTTPYSVSAWVPGQILVS